MRKQQQSFPVLAMEIDYFQRLSFPFSRFLLTNFTHIKKKRIFTRIYTKERF